MWQILKQYVEKLGWDVVVIKAMRILVIIVMAWVILAVLKALL